MFHKKQIVPREMSRNTAVGSFGESIACEHLASKGMKIVARNVRCGGGEIDIVARENVHGAFMTVFVEVKAVSREREGQAYDPLENVSREKMRRLRKAIQAYISMNRVSSWRFLVVSVCLGSKGHIINMFEEVL